MGTLGRKPGNKPFYVYDKTEINNKPTGFKNLIINGSFDVWQRGESFTLSANNSGFLADRSQVFMNSTMTDSILFERSNSALPDGKNVITYKMSNSSSNGNSGFAYSQPIEEYWYLWGQTLTFQFKYKTDTSHTRIVYGIFRDGPITTGQIFGLRENVNLVGDNNWHTYSVTFTCPEHTSSVNFDRFVIALSVGNGDTDTTEITELQLEEGSVATPFEHRPYGLELSLCQRYYQVLILTGINIVVYTSNGDTRGSIPFRTRMRVAPSCTINSSVYGIWFGTNNVATNVTYPMLPPKSTTDSIRLQMDGAAPDSIKNCGATAVGGSRDAITIKADAEL